MGIEDSFNDSFSFQQSAVASVSPKLAFQQEGIMSINETPLFKSGFQGQTNSFHRITTNQHVKVFGVYFYSHAIPVLLRIPTDLITNETVEISDILGSEGRVLEEKIMLSNCVYIIILARNAFLAIC